MFNSILIQGTLETTVKERKAIIIVRNEKYKVLFTKDVQLNKGDNILIEGQFITEEGNGKIILAHSIIENLNRINLLGRLGEDPAIKNTKGKKTICNFSLATDSFIDGETKTEWHKIVCFDKQAENCEKYLKKGSIVLITGYIKTEQWKDKKGNKKTTHKVFANKVQFVNIAQNKEEQSDNIPF